MLTSRDDTGWSNLVRAVRPELPLLSGVVTTAIFFTVGQVWLSEWPSLFLLGILFIWLFVVMVWCAFGVARHADELARRLGEPYGTLILTMAAISIEVSIMAIVMLDGKPNPTLPRDTVLAVLMIILNGMVGLCILVGAVRHGQQQYNLQGANVFLAVISSLAVISLVIPTFTKSTPDESMTPLQAISFALLTVALYGGFLMIQTARHNNFFLEPVQGEPLGKQEVHGGQDRRSTAHHAVFLFVTLLPIVILSHPLAKLLDFGIEDLGAPAGLGGVFIAILVLSPEGLAAYRAATRNHLQRSINLSLGSALSTIGLTIPAMLMISLFTGATLEIGLDPANIVLLAVTLVIAQITFSGAPTNVLLGVVHLVLFATFIVLVFNP